MGRREGGDDSGAVRRVCRHPAVFAALAAASLLSACATASTNGTSSEEGGPPQPRAAQAGQPGREAEGAGEKAGGEKPGADQAPEGRPGAGVLSPVVTAAYIPLKMLPCSLGAVGSLMGFLLSFDVRMVRDTIVLNCGGDWIITPDMLEGREPFRSVGRVERTPGPVAPPAGPPPGAAAGPLREPFTE